MTDIEQLEAMIDRHGLVGVLEMLSEVSGAKSQHVAEVWLDTRQAKAWDNAARRLTTFASALQVSPDRVFFTKN